jgi:hypothetical protein
MDLTKITPIDQLAIVARAIGNPDLPGQQLQRLLMIRQSWNKARGLPPSARRAFESVLKFAPMPEAAPVAAVEAPKAAAPVQAPMNAIEEARHRLATEDKMHHATRKRLEAIVEAADAA